MALQASLLVPASIDGVTTTLAATTASSAIVIGKNAMFVINTTQVLTITFGSATKAATTPSATVGLVIPANASYVFALGENYDNFKIFNTSASTTTYSYIPLSRF